MGCPFTAAASHSGVNASAESEERKDCDDDDDRANDVDDVVHVRSYGRESDDASNPGAAQTQSLKAVLAVWLIPCRRMETRVLRPVQVPALRLNEIRADWCGAMHSALRARLQRSVAGRAMAARRERHRVIPLRSGASKASVVVDK